MCGFFRQINLSIGIYYADILVLNGWDKLTNLLNLDIENLIFWGLKTYSDAKEFLGKVVFQNRLKLS